MIFAKICNSYCNPLHIFLQESVITVDRVIYVYRSQLKRENFLFITVNSVTAALHSDYKNMFFLIHCFFSKLRTFSQEQIDQLLLKFP